MWVLSDSDHNVGRDTVTKELVSQLTDETNTHCDEVDRMDNVHVATDLPESQIDTAPTSASSVDSEETQTVPVIDSDIPQISGHQHDNPQSDLLRHDSDQVTVRDRVVTRAGRVVKTVNRLIENMVQRPITWSLSPPHKAKAVA